MAQLPTSVKRCRYPIGLFVHVTVSKSQALFGQKQVPNSQTNYLAGRPPPIGQGHSGHID